jgi:hypothetical protein
VSFVLGLTEKEILVLPENIVQAVARVSAPVLTVYVNTSQSDPSRHSPHEAGLTWLLDTAAVRKRSLPYAEGRRCDQQVRRIVRFLEDRHPAEKSLVIFSGANTWQVIPMHEQVINQMTWGAPDISSLLTALHSHRRYVAVVVDHKAARFFELCNGTFDLIGTSRFIIDTSAWKHGEQGSVAAERAQKPRGPLRDQYQRRIDAQYVRLCHAAAQEAVDLAGKNQLDGLFLVGPDRLTQAIFDKIPQRLLSSTVRVAENFGGLSQNQLQKRIEPLVETFEQQRQLATVRLLQSPESAALTNPDEVLAQLQNGTIRSLVVAKDLNLVLRDCPKCECASTASDPLCPKCGTTRRPILLGDLIARVWSQRNVAVEFVAGSAAELLRQTGGLAGWRASSRLAAM